MKRRLAFLFILCLIVNACVIAMAGQLEEPDAASDELIVEADLPEDEPEAEDGETHDVPTSGEDVFDVAEEVSIEAWDVFAEGADFIAEAEDVNIGDVEAPDAGEEATNEGGDGDMPQDTQGGEGEDGTQGTQGGEGDDSTQGTQGGVGGEDPQGTGGSATEGTENPGGEPEDPDASAVPEVTVEPMPAPKPAIPVYTIPKTGAAKRINLGKSIQLAVKGRKIKSSASANKAVATVTRTGLVKARKAGKTTITVTLTNKKKWTLTVKVVDPTMPTGVTIRQGSRRMLSVGDQLQLAATVKPATAPQTVTWKSSAKGVAVVNSKGIVTARKPGAATITATSKKNGKKAVFTVVVRTKVPKKYMISHAMGGVGGKRYTNCREGFVTNYAEGHRIFEVDMEYTSDGKLIMWHSRRDQFNPKYSAGYVPTYKQFMNSKIFGKYTPLDVKGLIKLMNKYPDARVITDTKYTDTATIREQFKTIVSTARSLGMSSVLKRFVVEIYTPEMFKTVNGIYHFKEYMVTLYKAYSSAPSLSEMRSVASFCKQHGIKTVAMFTHWWKQPYEAILASYDLDIALYTTNNKKNAKNFFRRGITALFTDFLPPV